jgi:DNA-binding response OmpR family regulator/EAL domain-containing protein (putative c-di-GMP-specific phosphodiesterase class I)
MPYDTDLGTNDHASKKINLDLLLLHRNPNALAPIERAIAQQEWRYRTMSDLPELRNALDGGAKAILIDTAFLPELQRHLPRREFEKKERPQLFFISDRCDIETQLQAVRAGASQFFSDPLDIEALIAALAECITPRAKPYHKILIVEDDASQAKLVADLLRKGTFETHTVTEPLDIIDSIWRFQPDLIFMMDIDMQGVDSVVLTKLIRNRKESAAIPIICLSGEDTPEKRMLALQSGADDFLTLPIQLQQLLTTVRSRIERANAISSAGVCKSEKSENGLPHGEALLARLAETRSRGKTLEHSYGLIVLALGDPQFDLAPASGEDLEQSVAMMIEWLAPLLMRDDYLARIGDCHLALLVGRPKRQDVEYMAELTHEIVNYRLTSSAVSGNRFGISLAMLDSAQESSEELLRQGQSAATSAYQQGLQGYLSSAWEPSSPKQHRVAEPSIHKEQLLEALQNGSVSLEERLFVAPEATHATTQLLELTPQCREPVAPSDLYQLAAHYGLASEFDRVVCHLAIQRLAEYRQLAKPVKLILRQSVAVIEDGSYVEFIKSALRKLQIVGAGLMLEFELPSLATKLTQARHLFSQLADLGITISLSHFAGSRSAYKAIAYLKAAAVRPRISLLPAGREDQKQIPQLLHTLRVEIILPHVLRYDQIAALWSESADYIQADFTH